MTTIPTAEVPMSQSLDVMPSAPEDSAEVVEPAAPVAPPSTPTPQVEEPFAPAPRQRWERPALAALLLVTGALYLWDLSASGWANSFYSAAVQAGSESWKAFLFGASDAAASIPSTSRPPPCG